MFSMTLDDVLNDARASRIKQTACSDTTKHDQQLRRHVLLPPSPHLSAASPALYASPDIVSK